MQYVYIEERNLLGDLIGLAIFLLIVQWELQSLIGKRRPAVTFWGLTG